MFEITKNKQEILISVISNVCPQNANDPQSDACSFVTGNPKKGIFTTFIVISNSFVGQNNTKYRNFRFPRHKRTCSTLSDICILGANV